MVENKTKPTGESVIDFLNKVEPEQKRADCFELVKLMEKITGEPAVMWGPSIVGFGTYHYKYESGREGDMCLAGFAPRSPAIVVYATCGSDVSKKLLAKLGTYKLSGVCIHIKKLSDIDMSVLEALIKESIDQVKKLYG